MSNRFSGVLINSFMLSVLSESSKPDKQCVFALLLAESLCKEFNVKVKLTGGQGF